MIFITYVLVTIFGVALSADEQCFIRGGCIGEILETTAETNANNCLKSCKATDGCDNFSYNQDSGDCDLVSADCTFVDETCNTCVFGQALCNTENTVIMVMGGGHNGRLTDVELLRLPGSPSECDKPEDLPLAMDGAMGALIEGVPTICGGADISECFQYSFDNYEWTATESMDQVRQHASSVVVDDDSTTWWIGGGNPGRVNSSLIFQGGSFTAGPEMFVGAFMHCAVKVNSTHIFIAGGNTSEQGYSKRAGLLEWLTKKWTELPPMKNGRHAHSCGLVSNPARVVAVGGNTGDDATKPSSEIFNLETETWEEGPGIPGEAYLYDAEAVPFRDTFLLVGGNGKETSNNKDDIVHVYEFDPVNSEWITRNEDLATPRDNPVAFIVPTELLNC